MSRSGFGGVVGFMEREVEISLVRRLRNGDESAFDEIYGAFNARLYRFLNRMARNQDVAEDLVEETWLRFVSNSGDLDPDTRLGAWLFTVARNLYISYCRSRSREQSYATDLLALWPDDGSCSPLGSVVSKQFEARLESALEELPPTYREALLLVGVEGFRPIEAAAICGVSAEAFRQRLSRGRNLLSERLQGEGWIQQLPSRR